MNVVAGTRGRSTDRAASANAGNPGATTPNAGMERRTRTKRCSGLLRAALAASIPWLPAAGLASCYEDEIGTPLSVELIGPDTGLVDEKLAVLYTVSGRRLNGVIFTWGDGTVDSLATAGAQTASGAREHTYRTTGLFTVRARVEDAVEGVASAEVMINIQQSQ